MCHRNLLLYALKRFGLFWLLGYESKAALIEVQQLQLHELATIIITTLHNQKAFCEVESCAHFHFLPN